MNHTDRLKSHPPTRKEAITEVRRETKKRQQVWRLADRKTIRFVSDKHNDYYFRLLSAGCILSVMTDKEFNTFIQRFIELQKQKSAQKKLF